MAYNPDANGKVERGHSPIVKALAKACDRKMGNWPRLLRYALWADRTTHSTTTGYMSVELMLGKKPIMPIEQSVPSWTCLPRLASYKDSAVRKEAGRCRVGNRTIAPSSIEEQGEL